MEDTLRALWARMEATDCLVEALAFLILGSRPPHEAALTLAILRKQTKDIGPAATMSDAMAEIRADVRVMAQEILSKKIEKLERLLASNPGPPQ